MARWKKRLLALLVSVALALGIAEGLLRWKRHKEEVKNQANLLHVRSDNPRLIYEQRAGASVLFPGTQKMVTTNAAGYRDTEFSLAKPDGVYRIIAVGDSVTVGWYRDADETYPQVLERLCGAGVEVFNMGVSGYNSLQEVEVVRSRGLRYAPDLVLVGYVLNDNKESGADGGLSRYFTRTRSRLYDEIKIRIRRLKRRMAKDVTTEAFEELAGLVREPKIPVLVMVFPFMHVDDDGDYPHADEHAQVARLCERLGFWVLDLLEPFRAAGFESLRTGDDFVHPNARGHAVAAEALRAFLKRRGLR